jgi:hypothetical protein
VFVFALKRKKIPKNDSPLPDELSSVSYLEDEGEDSPASERVPVLPPQLSSYLLRNGIATIAMLVLGSMSFLTLLFIATKPTPDLVQQDNGVMARVRPLDRRVDSVPDGVVRFLEDRLPRVYTWSGLLVDADDPTGLKYIHDPGVEANTPKGEGVLLPTTLYNEQFIFDEPIRDKMLRDIAGMIKDGDVDKEIFKNDPVHPSLATVYRFILRGKIEYPQEVSTDRYRVRVAADIVKFSLTQSLGVKAKPIAEFLQDVYVRRASKIPQLMIHDAKRKDLLWYGRKDGFVIDSMVPVGPAQDVPGVPRN